MHPALLIDEVLEAILEYCSGWERKEYRWTLCQLARSCKAWKDPSLDRLWKRLDCIEPLLSLFDSSQVSVNASIADAHAYAAKVKHMTVSLPPAKHTTDDLVLPNLQSACLLRGGCFAPLNFIAAPTLREVQVDLGPVMRTEAAEARCHSLAATFRQLMFTPGSRLEKLRIRGWMAPVLADTLSTLCYLHSLVLLTGNSLTAGTLASFASFSNLQRLSVHASHIDAETFTAALSPTASFRALNTLRIRGSRSLICAILAIIPRGTLHSLYIEAEEYDQDPLAWKPTFDLLVSNASDTLTDFTIDQILESEEMDSIAFLSVPHTRFTLETLRPLRGLTALRRLTVDVMTLPGFTDRDIDHMASWWPHLEKLDFGTLPCAIGYNASLDTVSPKITLASLYSLAKHCRNLRTLILPFDTTAAINCAIEKPHEQIQAQTALRTLVLGGLPPATEGMSPFIQHILTAFPHLEEIECTSVDRSLLVDLSTTTSAKGEDTDAFTATLDGYANGQ
ncbi:hypothetical protein BC835DRAFT_212336 [Cytidiella melzeri]|nr:hypothetical protein BC835DRAFT_212336 [Cytidiella melzeri]